jgi:hypothetical protein
VNGSHNIVGNTIAYNESDRYGAGIRVSSGEHNIEGNVISNNRSHGGSAGIYIAKGNHTIINNTISENFSELSNGGGVFITGGTHIISGNTITNNTCTGDMNGWMRVIFSPKVAVVEVYSSRMQAALSMAIPSSATQP